MEHHLNIATAAKLVGISRRQIQREIQQGNLEVFEGDVSVTSLLGLYPHVHLHNEREIDRVERIQHNAVYKIQDDSIPSERAMADHINRLTSRLQEAEQTVKDYENLLLESRERLVDMQKNCDRQQKQTLAAFISWMMGQYHQVHH